MSIRVLIVTFVFEILLAVTHLMAGWLKKTDKYGQTERLMAQWELFPYDFKVNYFQKSANDKGASKPPKKAVSRSRVV